MLRWCHGTVSRIAAPCRRCGCPLGGQTPRMPDNDPAKALDELVADGTVMMLMTMIGTEHSSRPLTVAGCPAPA